MRMNRRNVLFGLGSLVAGGGAVLSSGAFSQVDATRDATFTVQADGSGNAYLGLSGTSPYVTTKTSESGATSSVIEFNFDSLNEDAVSTFEDVLTISNNAGDSSSRWVYVDDTPTELDNGTIDFVDSSDSSIVGESNAVEITDTGSENIDIVFNTNQGDPGNVNEITITAVDTDPNA